MLLQYCTENSHDGLCCKPLPYFHKLHRVCSRTSNVDFYRPVGLMTKHFYVLNENSLMKKREACSENNDLKKHVHEYSIYIYSIISVLIIYLCFAVSWQTESRAGVCLGHSIFRRCLVPFRGFKGLSGGKIAFKKFTILLTNLILQSAKSESVKLFYKSIVYFVSISMTPPTANLSVFGL